MLDILSFLPAKRKKSPSGWISFNAPCCHNRGNKPDRRGRGGLLLDQQGGWTYNCFNCRFTAGFTPGKSLSAKTRQFLLWLGLDQNEIEVINLDSLRHKSINGMIEANREPIRAVSFEERDLPEGMELVDPDNPIHTAYTEYLRNRAIEISDYPYMVSPESEGRNALRILIPFTYKNKVVGYTSRYMDNRTPKYVNNSQPGYVFGVDLQKPGWSRVIVVEGIFDALSINGLALMHNDINREQAQIIKNLHREVIVVPDQDEAGLNLVDCALEHGWAVSIPNWGEGVKDVNDAVVKYGRLGTLIAIVAAKETSKIKIELKRKQLAIRLHR